MAISKDTVRDYVRSRFARKLRPADKSSEDHAREDSLRKRVRKSLENVNMTMTEGHMMPGKHTGKRMSKEMAARRTPESVPPRKVAG